MSGLNEREGFLQPVIPIHLFTPLSSELFSPRPKFIKQVAIPGGVQSCYPTSLLNGWINQRTLSTQEALSIQGRIIAEDNKWFSAPFERGGITLRTFNRNPHDLRDFASAEVGRELEIEVWEIRKLHNLGMHLRNMIVYGYSVVGGDTMHAVLLQSYQKEQDKFGKIDPRIPDQTTMVMAKNITQMFSLNDHIVVLK